MGYMASVQGLIHPVQIRSHLICTSTDMEQRISLTTDKERQDIKKYPGFIHTKLMRGIKLGFRLTAAINHCQSPIKTS
jgi:hypothetical protein